MASTEPNTHYARYTPSNSQPKEATPLRSKAFTQIDNLPHPTNKHQTVSSTIHSHNFDTISEIKKKYGNLLNKNVQRPNQATENMAKYQNRPLSGTHHSKWQEQKKEAVSPHPNFDKHATIRYEKASTPIKRQTGTKDYCKQKTIERQSTLEQNRRVISAMKSELQTKLTQLNAETTMGSAKRQHTQSNQFTTIAKTDRDKEAMYQQYMRSNVPQVTSAHKNAQSGRKDSHKNEDFLNNYEKILSKYTNKVQPSNISYKQRERGESKSAKTDSKPRQMSHLQKYISKNKTQIETINSQQLSKISEKNSILLQNSIQLQQKPIANEQVKVSYVREIFDVRNDDMFRKTIDDSVHYKEKDLEKDYCYVQSKYMVNRNRAASRQVTANTSINKDMVGPSHKRVASTYQGERKRESTENYVGNIKGITAEQHYKYFNNQDSTKKRGNMQDSKEKYGNYYLHTASKQKQTTTNQPSKYALRHEAEQSEANLTNKSQIYHPSSAHKNSQSAIYNLKEKYARNTLPTDRSYLDNQSISKQYVHRQPSKKPRNTYEPKHNQQPSTIIYQLDKRVKNIQASNKYNLERQSFESRTPQDVQQGQHLIERKGHKDVDEKYQDRYRRVEESSSLEQPLSTNRAQHPRYLQQVRPIYSDITLPKAAKTYTNGFTIKLIPVEVDSQFTRRQDHSYTDRCSTSHGKQQGSNGVGAEPKNSSNFEENRRKGSDKGLSNNSIKTLVKTIGEQAVLDEQFRNNKIWFASQKQQSRWQTLKNQLRSSGIKLTDSQIKQEFQLAQSQNNPFFSASDCNYNIQSLVSSYAQAKKHWHEKISKKFDRKCLEEEGLDSSKIDFERKGFILIEDLVRFLNVESGSFLRNRDIAIIFKRISKRQEQISFEELVGAVCF